MTASLLIEQSRDLGQELHALLQRLDPAQWRDERAHAAREQVSTLETRLREMLAGTVETHGDADRAAVRQRLEELALVLGKRPPPVDRVDRDVRRQWKRFRKDVLPAYAALAASLRAEDIHLPNLRPTNYSRNAFHISGGIMALLMIQHVLTPTLLVAVPGLVSLWAWSMELFRRRSPALNRFLMIFFGRVAHPHEHHRVNSATWYATALLILALTVSPMACSLAVIVLGLGDPAAAIIGRRFGRIRLAQGRSLEGTSAFVVVGALASLAVLMVYFPALSLGSSIALAVAGATAGAVAELFSRRIDDNFTIPLAVGAGVSLAAFLLSV